MSNIIKYREDLISYIKSVVLKYCPYTEDRLSILEGKTSPELDIEFNICNDESQIMFLFGNNSFKTSVPEKVETSYIIKFEEVCDVIDFLLEDHEVINNINFDNRKIDLKFGINWTDKSIKGINCNGISLNMYFENLEMKKQYLYSLFQRYNTYLEQTPSFKVKKNEYIDNMKHSYLDTLDKTGLISLLSKMNENELKKILYNLDNNTFLKYVTVNKEQPKVKILSLENNSKNK